MSQSRFQKSKSVKEFKEKITLFECIVERNFSKYFSSLRIAFPFILFYAYCLIMAIVQHRKTLCIYFFLNDTIFSLLNGKRLSLPTIWHNAVYTCCLMNDTSWKLCLHIANAGIYVANFVYIICT